MTYQSLKVDLSSSKNVNMSEKDDDSTCTPQAVSERRQGGALVAVSGNSVRERPQKTALDEEEFTGVRLVSI